MWKTDIVKYYIQTLNELNEQANLEYLTEPITNLLSVMEETIFFSNYIITDKTIVELKKQKERIKSEIIQNDINFKFWFKTFTIFSLFSFMQKSTP